MFHKWSETLATKEAMQEPFEGYSYDQSHLIFRAANRRGVMPKDQARGIAIVTPV
jgi:hypothetical protein